MLSCTKLYFFTILDNINLLHMAPRHVYKNIRCYTIGAGYIVYNRFVYYNTCDYLHFFEIAN